MKKKILATVLVICAVIGSFSIGAVAASNNMTISALLSFSTPIKYNGQYQTFTDVNGNTVYPILYNGTTYLPVRAVCNMLGIPVDYDANTGTVLLGDNGVVVQPQQAANNNDPAALAILTNQVSLDQPTLTTLNIGCIYNAAPNVPVNASSSFSLAVSGDLSQLSGNVQVRVAGEVVNQSKNAWMKKVNGQKICWEKDESGNWSSSYREPNSALATSTSMIKSGSLFSDLKISKQDANEIVLEGKGTQLFDETFNVSESISKFVNTPVNNIDIPVKIVVDATTMRLKSLTANVAQNPYCSYYETSMWFLDYEARTLVPPADLPI